MDREKEIYKVTVAGGAINVVLLAFKFIAGILGHSSAMIADAVHSFSDFITDVVVIVFVRISGMPQDKSHDYGHGKYETLATTIIGLALAAVAVDIFWKGGVSIAAWLQGEQLPAPGMLAFWAAIASIALKELTYRFTIRKAKELNSPAVEANAWHHRSDAMSSIGTAIGIGGAVLLGQRWTVLDPLASVIVGAFIMKVAVELTVKGMGELMERSLPDDVENEIIAIVESVPDVIGPHDLRTRRIGNRIAIEMHVFMNGEISLCTAHDHADAIEDLLKQRFGSDTHVAIHMEPANCPCHR